jgi:hypothetical protein
MGLFYNLFVETGASEKGNDRLTSYFLSIGNVTTEFGTHKMTMRLAENNIGIIVSVKETGWTGLQRFGEREIANKVGIEFFKLLIDAPEFRYAMVGIEAGEWVDGQNIRDEDFNGYLPDHGLVLKNELASIIKKQLVPFKEGYCWIPYEGEIEGQC